MVHGCAPEWEFQGHPLARARVLAPRRRLPPLRALARTELVAVRQAG